MSELELLNSFEKKQVQGFQVTKRKGFLSSTWLIYKKDESFYFFDISEEIEFNAAHRYSKKEFLEEFEGASFEIEVEVG